MIASIYKAVHRRLSQSPKTGLRVWIRLLPFAFTLHNFEEVLGMQKWSRSIPNYIHPPVTTLEFLIAVSMFSILGFVLVFTRKVQQSEYYHQVIAGFCSILLLNVFFPHLLATIIFNQYAPGVITALLINLPLSLMILWQLDRQKLLSRRQLLLSGQLGGLVGLVLAYTFLKLGDLMTHNITLCSQSSHFPSFCRNIRPSYIVS